MRSETRINFNKKFILKSADNKHREISLSMQRLHKYWACDQVRDNPVCSATETTCSIEILPEVGLSVTISRQIRWL